MRTVLCLTLFLYSAHAVSFLNLVLKEWQTWKLTHLRAYDSHQEEMFRFKIFLQNKANVDEHNRQAQQGKHSYTQKMNKYGDLLNHEFRAMLNGYKHWPKNQTRSYYGAAFIKSAHVDRLPPKVDWRKLGAVTPVKDQVIVTTAEDTDTIMFLVNRDNVDPAGHSPLQELLRQ